MQTQKGLRSAGNGRGDVFVLSVCAERERATISCFCDVKKLHKVPMPVASWQCVNIGFMRNESHLRGAEGTGTAMLYFQIVRGILSSCDKNKRKTIFDNSTAFHHPRVLLLFGTALPVIESLWKLCFGTCFCLGWSTVSKYPFYSINGRAGGGGGRGEKKEWD